ncbi:unnamed protein product [Cuscuta campestris]|uniref:Uncharacterized protein n=1 Tax=Cuscuta campestris TaxID=132261 RepID=A0A484LAI5_9ASTE|nr:unnamed protein product [Cuscuta campestris]
MLKLLIRKPSTPPTPEPNFLDGKRTVALQQQSAASIQPVAAPANLPRATKETGVPRHKSLTLNRRKIPAKKLWRTFLANSGVSLSDPCSSGLASRGEETKKEEEEGRTIYLPIAAIALV